MRVEMIGLRTWLWGTFASWAVLVCVLAAFGLGERVELLPDDPELAQPLPTLPASMPERLGPRQRYSEIAAHPVFAEDRLPHPFFLSGNDNNSTASAVKLTGVLLTPYFKMATLTLEPNASVRIKLGGEAVQGWRLLALQPRSATIEGPGGAQTLELKVFNGQGGQPPTSNATATSGSSPPEGAAPAPSGNNPPQPPAQQVPAVAQQSNGQTSSAAPAHAGSNGVQEAPRPSEEQMRAIRDRIETRRRQLQQQQQRQDGNSSGQPQ